LIDYAVKQGWITPLQGWALWLVIMLLLVSAVWYASIAYKQDVDNANSCLRYISSPNPMTMRLANVSIESTKPIAGINRSNSYWVT